MTLNVADLSSNNGYIDLAALKRAGCQAVIIKATEGTSYTNPYFTDQIQQAIRLGLKIGAYHFFTGVGASVEVNHYWQVVKPYAAYIDKHVADYEGASIVMAGPGYGIKILQLMKQITGKVPVIYMGLSDENNYNWGAATDYPLWIAQYNNYNRVYGFAPRALYGCLRHWKSMTMFQYSASTWLAGYGPLDASIYYGDDWRSGISTTERGDDILSTKIGVPINVKYGVVIANKSGAQVYEDADLSKPIKGKVLKYSSTFKGFDLKDGAINLGGNQWIDGRDAMTKFNPFALSTNSNIHGICQITDKSAYCQPTPDRYAKGYNHLPFGNSYKVFGRSGKYLIVGAGNNKYIDSDKVKIIL